MNDNAKWRVVRLDDLERRGRFIPVREALGIHSFGINAIKQGEDGGGRGPIHSGSRAAYGEQRYADAAAAVRRGLEQSPAHPGLNYNYACFATVAGEVDDETFERLRRSVELFPPFRAQAREDDD